MKRLSVTLIFAFVSTALCAAPGFAQAQQGSPGAAPDSARQAAAAQFQADHGSAWQIRWSEQTGTPATLMSGKATGYGGAPEQAGRTFLEDHAPLFGIEDARTNLRVARQNASRSGSARVLYQQVYRGVPVLASGYLVAIGGDGAVYYVSGDYYPDLKLPSITPSVSAQAVVHHMREDLDVAGSSSAFEVLEQPELVVYVDKGDAGSGSSGADAGSAGEALSYHLAYVAEAQRRSPLAAFKYVIDAQSGAVLYETSLVEDAGARGFGAAAKAPASIEGEQQPEGDASPAAALVNGSGEVYRTNPLHGSPVTETLTRLRNRSPRELYGYEIDVNDRFGNDATSSSGEFDYSPSDFRFDQVMVYYHSNDFEAWLVNDLGWTDDTGEVDAETRSAECYACTTPSQENAFYSDGSGYSFRNPTREASVMAHEQMHIVSEKYDDLNHPGDGDALDEGYSDYFAVAYRIDRQGGMSTEVGEYTLVGFYDVDRQLNNDFDDRDADNDDNNINDFYDASLVFSGALWDFTTDVATDVEEAATITLGSLNYLDGDPSFMDARNALVAAANDVVGPSYTCGIKRKFANHGIGSDPFSVSARGNGLVEEGRPYTYRVTLAACAPSGSPSYQWGFVPASGGARQILGTGSSLTTSFFEDGILDVLVTKGAQIDGDFLNITVQGSGGGCPPGTLCDPGIGFSADDGSAKPGLPEAFALEGSAPNPVRTGEVAQIRVAVPEVSLVELALYDARGREVTQIVEQQMQPGVHRVPVETPGLASGVYFYRMRTDTGFADTGTLVVVK